MQKVKKKEKIDIVILWVDGSDPKWLEKKKQVYRYKRWRKH